MLTVIYFFPAALVSPSVRPLEFFPLRKLNSLNSLSPFHHQDVISIEGMWQSHQLFWGSEFETSHKGAIRAEDVRVAFAVHVLRVALDAVAAVHLSQR